MESRGAKSFVYDHDILYGHRLTNLFHNTRDSSQVMARFITSVADAIGVIRFNSPMLSKYYAGILLDRTKQHFRLTLKYQFYVIMILFLESAVRDPLQHEDGGHYVMLLCIPICIMYLLTLYNPRNSVYVSLSFILSISSVVMILGKRSMIIRQNNGLHSPGMVVILCMFVLLPLNTRFCVVVSSLFIMLSVSFQLMHCRLPYAKQVSDELLPFWNIDIFERLHGANTSRRANEPTKSIVFHTSFPWIPIIFIGLYLRFCNRVRRHFAFFKLGRNVRDRRKCDEALRGQVRWIEAIMPAVVRGEYQALRQRNIDSGSNMWVFNKAFDNVSILFADIVGFTRMSSNKKAHRVVTMLNDLFNRFDELCDMCNCEKIGTLGDCYYCVSGCPVPRQNHAVCCIEMGLGMCRIIKVFNCDFHESVSMRIGVHTGRVNAAIIGAQRFRFDVYSYDVIIASELESSGKPGRVHISKNVFDLVDDIYNVSEGEPLAVKKEQVSGIAGMELTTTYIDTYFVDPRSSLWRKKHEKFGQSLSDIRSLLNQHDLYESEQDMYSTVDSITQDLSKTKSHDPNSINVLGIPWREIGRDDAHASGNKVVRQFEDDINLMYNLQTDPAAQYNLFRSPPLWPLSLAFCDKETEWHYGSHIKDSTRRNYIDSQKVTLLGDVPACLFLGVFYQFMLSLCSMGEGTEGIYFILTISCINLVSGLIAVCLIFISTNYESWIDSSKLRILYRFTTRPWIREIYIGLLTLMPSITFISVLHNGRDSKHVIINRATIGALGFHCILVHCVPLSSVAWARTLCAIISFCTVGWSIYNLANVGLQQTELCASSTMFHSDIPFDRFSLVYLVELFVLVGLVALITRENERNSRLCFYVTREAEIIGDEAELAAKEAQDMLYNIIPKYVHNRLQLLSRQQHMVKSKSFNYAVFVQHAAVAFATISNFFSKYYREDYKGGENALKLLNSIVCMFDDLLTDSEMKDVEKIKTINDCYMVAAGLNEDEVKRNPSELTHLVALMRYCHRLIEALEKFNDMYIIGTDKFEVKVGYNTGPLIAGIIGSTKPMYDIWGNTVNVASRMYSTGLVGKIQVPNYVANKLKDHFEFVYRGNIFVKGKGDMKVYLCERML